MREAVIGGKRPTVGSGGGGGGGRRQDSPDGPYFLLKQEKLWGRVKPWDLMYVVGVEAR